MSSKLDRERDQRDYVQCDSCKAYYHPKYVKSCACKVLGGVTSPAVLLVDRKLEPEPGEMPLRHNHDPDFSCPLCFRNGEIAAHAQYEDEDEVVPDEVEHRPFCAGWTDHDKDGPGCRRMDLSRCNCEPDEVERACEHTHWDHTKQRAVHCDCYDAGHQRGQREATEELRVQAIRRVGLISELYGKCKLCDREWRDGTEERHKDGCAAAIRRGKDGT